MAHRRSRVRVDSGGDGARRTIARNARTTPGHLLRARDRDAARRRRRRRVSAHDRCERGVLERADDRFRVAARRDHQRRHRVRWWRRACWPGSRSHSPAGSRRSSTVSGSTTTTRRTGSRWLRRRCCTALPAASRATWPASCARPRTKSPKRGRAKASHERCTTACCRRWPSSNGDPTTLHLARMAREQERDLREFLFGAGSTADRGGARDVGPRLRAAAARFEDAFGGRVDVVLAPDLPHLKQKQADALAGRGRRSARERGQARRCDKGHGLRRARRRWRGPVLGSRRRKGLRSREDLRRGRPVAVDTRKDGRGRRPGRHRQPARCRSGGAVVAAVRVVLADDHPIWRSGVRTDLGEGVLRRRRGG